MTPKPAGRGFLNSRVARVEPFDEIGLSFDRTGRAAA